MSKTKKNREDEDSRKPNPTVLSINICDAIIRDELTKKVSLVGLFNVIRANSFPCTHPLMHVYVALTNGHGKYKTEVRFANLETSEPIVGMVGELNFQNPLQVVEMNLCWQQVSFDNPGEYEVEVLCDGTRTGARKFRLIGPQQEIPPISGPDMR